MSAADEPLFGGNSPDAIDCPFHGKQPKIEWSVGNLFGNPWKSEELCFRCYAEAMISATKAHQVVLSMTASAQRSRGDGGWPRRVVR